MWADVVKKKICLWSGKGTFLVSEGNTALSIVDSGLERMNEGAVANGENWEPLGVGETGIFVLPGAWWTSWRWSQLPGKDCSRAWPGSDWPRDPWAFQDTDSRNSLVQSKSQQRRGARIQRPSLAEAS